VQRFTNNPKYKDGALFVKGELRKARSTLVDEGRRMAYQREMMTQRAQQIRNILRPLLIKGYLVEEEFKYLNQHAGRLEVPEAMVQQVLKQELQKKGIDPATALVEGSGVPGKVSAKALPTGPQRKKKAVSMSLAARFTLFRDPLGTFIALCVWPLRMVGILKSPPKQVVQQAGFFDYHPFVATSLFWIGLLALALPFPFIRMTTTIGVQGRDKDRYINEIRDQQDKIKKFAEQKAGADAGSKKVDRLDAAEKRFKDQLEKLSATTAKRWTSLLAQDAVSKQEADEKAGDLAAKTSLVNAATAASLDSVRRRVPLLPLPSPSQRPFSRSSSIATARVPLPTGPIAMRFPRRWRRSSSRSCSPR